MARKKMKAWMPSVQSPSGPIFPEPTMPSSGPVSTGEEVVRVVCIVRKLDPPWKAGEDRMIADFMKYIVAYKHPNIQLMRGIKAERA